MSEEEFKECSVVAYPRQIKFLHINGGAISYYVDRHVSDYVDRLQQENQELKGRIEYLERSCERKDESNIELYSENVDLSIDIGVSAYEFGEGLRNRLLKTIESEDK